MIRLSVVIIFAALFFSSCKHADEKRTESGMKYLLYKENPGPKAKRGDYVTVDMVYKTDFDSVLFDSKENKMPMRFQLERPPFRGSMEEGLTYMAAGDSATFFVPADSMVRKVFAKMAADNYVRPAFLKSGSFLKFDVKLLRIQSELEAAEELYHESDRRVAAEKETLRKYTGEHNITQKSDTSGIYIIKKTEGTGTVIDSGKTVSVNYIGKFLTGEIFDSNDKLHKPYSFQMGSKEVMKGWEIAFMKLRQGDKAELIIPSNLAFGEEGLRNKMNGSFIIQPNTPLLFEVEIVSVK